MLKNECRDKKPETRPAVVVVVVVVVVVFRISSTRKTFLGAAKKGIIKVLNPGEAKSIQHSCGGSIPGSAAIRR